MHNAILAIVSVVCVVAGVAMWSVPAALVVLGVFGLVAAYVIRYLEVARSEVS